MFWREGCWERGVGEFDELRGRAFLRGRGGNLVWTGSPEKLQEALFFEGVVAVVRSEDDDEIVGRKA